MSPLVTVHLLLLLVVNSIHSHPQCLDFLPPFSNVDLEFCADYTQATCCTVERDRELKEMYERILDDERLKNDVVVQHTSVCRDYLREILCQECSPYAAHILGAEDDMVRNAFPGLCPKYCAEFYDKCNKLIPFMSSDARLNDTRDDKDGFCSSLTLSDPDYCYPDWVNSTILNGKISRESRTEEGCLCLERFAPDVDFASPIFLRSPPDDSGRIVVGEMVGVVYVFFNNNTMAPEPFLNISEAVVTTNLEYDERGLMNLAFHPMFRENGKLYVCYSIFGSDGKTQKMRVSEFRVSEDNPNQVDYSSERFILEVAEPYRNHNGGEVRLSTHA